MRVKSRNLVAGNLAVMVGVATAVLLLVPYAISFVDVSSTVRDAASNTTDEVAVLGVPLFEGFSTEGRHGVHMRWGTPVALLLVPLVTATVAGLWARRRVRSG